MRRVGLIRREDPPPPATRRAAQQVPWAVIAVALRENHPNEWWVVQEGNSGVTMPSTADRINNGESWWHPKGSYEAKVRTVNDVQTLYVRYVGQ